VELLH
jgi:hypothetical protein